MVGLLGLVAVARLALVHVSFLSILREGTSSSIGRGVVISSLDPADLLAHPFIQILDQVDLLQDWGNKLVESSPDSCNWLTEPGAEVLPGDKNGRLI